MQAQPVLAKLGGNSTSLAPLPVLAGLGGNSTSLAPLPVLAGLGEYLLGRELATSAGSQPAWPYDQYLPG